MKEFALQTLVISLVIGLGACGDDPGGDNGKPGGSSDTSYFTENTVKLSSVVANPSGAAGVKHAAVDTISDCTYISDIYSINGACITPTKVTGYAEQAHLLKEYGQVGGGTRILGKSEFESTPGGILDGDEVDLSNPNALVTNNTLREQYSAREQHDTLSVSMAYTKIQFPLTISSGTKHVTMLLAKYGQPFASSEAIDDAIADCGLSANATTQSRYVDADLLPGLSFKRGDYLFCVKDNETDTCAVADFQWLDTSNNSLTTTRPTTPKTSHYLANNKVQCSNEGNDRVNFDFGPFGFYASINASSQFKLWSDFSHGEYSNQWSTASVPMNDDTILQDKTIAWVSPYNLYYYQNCGSGSCGATSEGTNLDVTLEFDTTQMILVQDLDTDTISTTSNIGDVLAKTHVKGQWAFDQKSQNNIVGFDGNDMVSMSVDPVITLTGSTSTPPDGAITHCDEIESGTPSNCSNQ